MRRRSNRSSDGSTSSIPFQVDDAALANFEEFYAQHRDAVAQTLALGFNDVELGYESADEAMARAFRSWSTVSEYDNPEGWVFRVGLNWGRSWLRRRVTASIKAPLFVERRVPTIEELAVDPDLQTAIAELMPKQRIVVALRFHHDYSIPQIAEALDVAEGTVKSRLNRAMKLLATRLATTEHGEDS